MQKIMQVPIHEGPISKSKWSLSRKYLTLLILMASSYGYSMNWLQWGGPNGDFTTKSDALLEKWPEYGPKLLWKIPLGDGYSSILYKDGSLFTMFSEGEYEVVTSLSASTGKTIWEDRYKREFWPDMRLAFGPGPNATPLIMDDKIISIGIAGQMRCLNLETGQLIWKRNLPKEFGRLKRVEEYGYSNSPIRYKNLALIQVGGDKHSVIAINPENGASIWESVPGGVSYAQPTVIKLAGVDQFIYFTPEGVNGLDPENGDFLWHSVIPVGNGNHLTPAVQCDENHLFISSQFNSGGGRLLKITQGSSGMQVEQIWFNQKMRASCWTFIRRGEVIYGSTGGHNSSFLSAFNWKTGKFSWRKRGFHMAQSIYADQKFIFLDTNGNLSMAKISPDSIEIIGTINVSKKPSWTLPTLVDTQIFIRDRKNIQALSLSSAQ